MAKRKPKPKLKSWIEFTLPAGETLTINGCPVTLAADATLRCSKVGVSKGATKSKQVRIADSDDARVHRRA